MTDIWAGALARWNNAALLSFPRRLALIFSKMLTALEVKCNLLRWFSALLEIRCSLCLLWWVSQGASIGLSLLRLLFGFWDEMMDPFLIIHSHKPQQKLARVCLKKVQISTRHIPTCMLLINCQKSGLPSCWKFSYIQIFRKNGMKSVLSNPNNTTRLSPITISGTLVTISRVAKVRDRPYWTGSSSRLSLPRLNSAT